MWTSKGEFDESGPSIVLIQSLRFIVFPLFFLFFFLYRLAFFIPCVNKMEGKCLDSAKKVASCAARFIQTWLLVFLWSRIGTDHKIRCHIQLLMLLTADGTNPLPC